MRISGNDLWHNLADPPCLYLQEVVSEVQGDESKLSTLWRVFLQYRVGRFKWVSSIQRVKDPVANADSAVDFLSKYSKFSLWNCFSLYFSTFATASQLFLSQQFCSLLALHTGLTSRTQSITRSYTKRIPKNQSKFSLILSVLSGQFSLILSHIPCTMVYRTVETEHVRAFLALV